MRSRVSITIPSGLRMRLASCSARFASPSLTPGAPREAVGFDDDAALPDLAPRVLDDLVPLDGADRRDFAPLGGPDEGFGLGM
jgi:hypothetical protein